VKGKGIKHLYSATRRIQQLQRSCHRQSWSKPIGRRVT